MPPLKIPAVLAFAAALVANPALAQSYDGDWAGALEAGGQTLHLVLHMTTVGGKPVAVMDSVDQGATIPATAVKTEGGQLSILFLSIGGELAGKLSADGKQIVGNWSQGGGSLPLTMTKKAAK
jgi:hypothetical protein